MTCNRNLTVITLLALLVGCGGGSSSAPQSPQTPSGGSAPPPAADEKPPATGVTVGVVTGFGSIYVNGVEFDTDTAIVLDDDMTVSEEALEVGDLVRIEGTVSEDGSTGIARRVVYDAEVKGPISSIDRTAESFVVLGVTVFVDRATVFAPGIAPASLAGLQAGDPIEVSGFADGATVLATRIEPEETGLELKGRIATLDAGARQLTIAEQRVDYTDANLVDFGSAGPEVGQLVEARGTTLDGSGTLVAVLLELEASALEDASDDDTTSASQRPFALEGLVKTVDGDRLTIGTTVVGLTDETLFENGDRAQLENGMRVEASGILDQDGLPMARRIEISARVDASIEGTISALRPDVEGFEVLGIEVRISPKTQFEDDSASALRRFAYADLRAEDFVEVRGQFSDGVLNALRIERDDGDDDDSGPDVDDGDREDEDHDEDSGDDELAGDGATDDDSVSEGGESDADDDSAPGTPATVVDLELEGIATTLTATEAAIKGLTFSVEADTRFEIADQVVPSDEFLAIAEIGDRLEIDARRLTDGRLAAVKIELEDAEIERRGPIESVGLEAITISGLEFVIDANTRLRADDVTIDAERFLELASPGVLAEVEGRPAAAGPPIAIEIELESEED